MNKVDTEVVKFALSTTPNKSDAEIAKACGVTPTDVATTRASLGISQIKKNTETLKQYAARYIMEMTESEKKEFIQKLPADLVWRMAEGQPATTGTLDLINTEPIKIDISHQLHRIYGTTGTPRVLEHSEGSELPAGTSK